MRKQAQLFSPWGNNPSPMIAVLQAAPIPVPIQIRGNYGLDKKARTLTRAAHRPVCAEQEENHG
ncbi:hypothetical protein [Pseudomonas sp. Kh13]|uniref:hypothetical protein n=1 Tax=Pseudomonas sp. Kh13 TaxID=2093744 RepID=UPI00118420F6|nr:hypothetical protein [Pseudomonas sp. Kh13]